MAGRRMAALTGWGVLQLELAEPEGLTASPFLAASRMPPNAVSTAFLAAFCPRPAALAPCSIRSAVFTLILPAPILAGRSHVVGAATAPSTAAADAEAENQAQALTLDEADAWRTEFLP